MKKTQIMSRRPGASDAATCRADQARLYLLWITPAPAWSLLSQRAPQSLKNNNKTVKRQLVTFSTPPTPRIAGIIHRHRCGNINQANASRMSILSIIINGLTSFCATLSPIPYDFKKIRRDFPVIVGSRVVPFSVPPNHLKTNTKSEYGTVEPWNRISSHVRARTRINSWFHGSKVPYLNKTKKNNDLSGTEKGTALAIAVPYPENLLNIRYLIK